MFAKVDKLADVNYVRLRAVRFGAGFGRGRAAEPRPEPR
jgi:hypothetical protein